MTAERSLPTSLSPHALNVLDATPDDAEAVLAVIRVSFGARRRLDPPSTASDETVESVRAALAESGGILVERRGKPIGAMIFDESRPGQLGFRRVSVDPSHQDRGVASAMVGVAEDTAEERGYDSIWLQVREELAENVEFWSRRRFIPVRRDGHMLEFGKTLWVARELPRAEHTREFGRAISSLLRAGDVVVLSGDLGAGKTTLTQGIGDGLGVRGPVTSPTFVLARSHPPLDDGPALVHVDAYRLRGDVGASGHVHDAGASARLELDDLDLDTALDESVTVVEWGDGLAEDLAESWLEVRLERRAGNVMDPVETIVDDDPADGEDMRVAVVKPHGPRWVWTSLRSTLLDRDPGRPVGLTEHPDGPWSEAAVAADPQDL